MISLFGSDDAVLGLAALLDLERIPFARVPTAAARPGELIVAVGGGLTAVETDQLGAGPALVFKGGPIFAERRFGAGAAAIAYGPCEVPLDQPVWPEGVRALAGRFGKSHLALPYAPMCTSAGVVRGEVLAWLTADGNRRPAVVRYGQCLWSAIDFGGSFGSLVNESYAPARPIKESVLRPWARRAAEEAYSVVPEALRRRLRARSHASLARRRDAHGPVALEYPIDCTGWLVMELVRCLIVLAHGVAVRVERWPAPYDAAAAVTHDVEPVPYAYKTGLRRVLERTETVGYAPTFGFVATAAERYLGGETAAALREHDVLCHGLTHRGERVAGRLQLSFDLASARARLEKVLGRPVRGYRSPRLERSPDLLWALDGVGFQYDSSFPDVDRENLDPVGAGVRLNVPYRPFVGKGRTLRPSKCLELPLTAPDCVEPPFAQEDVAAVRAAVTAKAAFLRATGGLYVAVVNGGLFSDDDAAMREAHFDFVLTTLRQPGVWMATLDEIAAWWEAREAVRISVYDGMIGVGNDGVDTVAGLRVCVEWPDRRHVLLVPPVPAGDRVLMPLPLRDTPETAPWLREPVERTR